MSYLSCSSVLPYARFSSQWPNLADLKQREFFLFGPHFRLHFLHWIKIAWGLLGPGTNWLAYLIQVIIFSPERNWVTWNYTEWSTLQHIVISSIKIRIHNCAETLTYENAGVERALGTTPVVLTSSNHWTTSIFWSSGPVTVNN